VGELGELGELRLLGSGPVAFHSEFSGLPLPPGSRPPLVLIGEGGVKIWRPPIRPFVLYPF
jgi:hypothetical protein